MQATILYRICYWVMLAGYLGVSIQAPTLKQKVIGLLLTIVNGLIF